MTKFKKIFPVIFLAVFLFLILAGFSFAAKELELDYPEVPGAETPTTIKTLLPGYIKYLFNLAIVIAGIVAFFSLVYGGFRYLTSAGSPVAMSDAKSQITAGILGLAIILGSWLLLTTINPQLTVLQIGTEELDKGVILYAGACEGSSPSGEEGVNFLRVRRSLSDLEDFTDKTQNIYFYNPAEELEVEIYPGIDWQPEGVPSFKSYDHAANDCKAVGGGSASIKLHWKMPGVYLYELANFQHPPDPRLYVANVATFGDFDDKAKSLKILPWAKQQMVWKVSKCPGVSIPPGVCNDRPDCCELESQVYAKLLAILHEKENYQGDCQVFFEDHPDLTTAPCTNSGSGPFCKENIRDRASSIHIFKQLLNVSSTGKGATLYSNYDWNEEEGGKDYDGKGQCGPYSPDQPQWIDSCVCSEVDPGDECKPVLEDKKGSSIKVEGNFIALLFRDDGRCQVFTPPGDYRLKDDHIGDDQARYMLVIPVSKEETF